MGEQRTLNSYTLSAGVLLSNREFFITKWKYTEIDGGYILNNKVVKQLDLFKTHIYITGLPEWN